ncbi:hypothetical protein D3M22_25270, partial [Salmonella enterica subsp. enterica serovar Kentucky]|nr:hypothetical protein [Salmonella enterica subsp. enterica serovar Kentucky]
PANIFKIFYATLTLTETADRASSINIIFIITPTSIFDANRLDMDCVQKSKHTHYDLPLSRPNGCSKRRECCSGTSRISYK